MKKPRGRLKEMKITHKNPAILIGEIEFAHGFEYGTLSSKQASRYISKARREAILGLREMGLSWPEIGRMLNRDHTSVIRMINPVHKRGDNAGITSGKRVGKSTKKKSKVHSRT